MKEIGKRVWYEPAVAVGLLISVALVIINLLGDTTWDVQTILFVLSPLLTALGIRPFVKPTAKIDDENAEAARDKLKV